MSHCISISVTVIINFLSQIFFYNRIAFVWNAVLVLRSWPVLAVFISRLVLHLPGPGGFKFALEDVSPSDSASAVQLIALH